MHRRTHHRLGALAGAALILAGLLPASLATPPPVGASVPTVINEVLASTTGTDVEYLELYGTPGASLSGLSLVYVESNNGTSLGTIDFRYDFGATATLGGNGFYLIGTTASLISTYGVTPNVDIATNSLENSSATVGLVQTASLGGTTVTGTEVVLDAVGITDATASTFAFGAPVVGPDGSFFPAGVRRVADGVDNNAAADWVIADFNLGPANTPTAGTAPDTAPSVAATNPAAGSTNVPVSGDISVTFNESVDVAAGAISVQCPTGTEVAENAAAADVATVTIDPAANLPGDTACSIVIDAAGVTDNDGTPHTLAGTTTFAFTTGSATPITPIHAIQGSGGAASPGTFTIEGIVVGDYQAQGSGRLRGFFVQEEDADADANPATSEGIFVFCSSCPVAVSVGDRVRATGASSEFFNMSQLSATTAGAVTVLGSDQPLPTPASVALPVPGVPEDDLAAATAAINAYFEAFEGMLVTFPDTLSVAEYFELARYGQLVLTEGGRPHQFTAVSTPTAAGLVAHEIDVARRTVILDDTDNRQNRPVDTPNTAYYHPVPGLSTGNDVRGGDTITNLTGVLHWSFAGQTGTDAWRIRPVTEAFSYAFTPANPRPALPDVGGSLTVASFNVLNYFLTIDTTSSSSAGPCGPDQDQDCRGADSAAELARQRTKLLAALTALDADVVGLMELENTPGVEPLADIVAGLPGYAYVSTGVIGTDPIRVGIIYRTATVTPVGAAAVLASPAFVDPRNTGADQNRPAVAQAFEETATGARFTVVVNHLKSKGEGCGLGDDDTATGQGNCNLTRTLAAQALADWLATDPTGSGDPDALIIGDLNSYAKEDPIAALQGAGYTDLVAAYGGPDAYGYVFDGQLGYLDHALANAALASQVTGVAEWHINADEIPLFDYNDDVRDAGESAFEEESDVLPLYEPNAFRTSDHDPVLVGLDLALHAPEITSLTLPVAPVRVGTSAALAATFTDADGGDTHTASVDWGDGDVESLGPVTSPVAASHAYAEPGLYTVTLTVTDRFGLSDSETFAYVVVYDPAGGFVTGGGRVWSPAGALVADPDVEGPASFELAAKYGKDAVVPKGDTSFAFALGDFAFVSTSYDWLVVNGSKAIYAGTGTVNGAGTYGFLVSAWDGQAGGGDDRLRLRVWDAATGATVYDNQAGAPDDATASAAILGGSIVVHKAK